MIVVNDSREGIFEKQWVNPSFLKLFLALLTGLLLAIRFTSITN